MCPVLDAGIAEAHSVGNGLTLLNLPSPSLRLDLLEPLKHKVHYEPRIQIITALVEGNSLRATARMCDVSFNTVLKLVPHVGIACMEFQDKMLRRPQGLFAGC